MSLYVGHPRSSFLRSGRTSKLVFHTFYWYVFQIPGIEIWFLWPLPCSLSIFIAYCFCFMDNISSYVTENIFGNSFPTAFIASIYTKSLSSCLLLSLFVFCAPASLRCLGILCTHSQMKTKHWKMWDCWEVALTRGRWGGDPAFSLSAP